MLGSVDGYVGGIGRSGGKSCAEPSDRMRLVVPARIPRGVSTKNLCTLSLERSHKESREVGPEKTSQEPAGTHATPEEAAPPSSTEGSCASRRGGTDRGDGVAVAGWPRRIAGR